MWLATGGLTVVVAALTALRLPAPGCVGAGGAAGSGTGTRATAGSPAHSPQRAQQDAQAAPPAAPGSPANARPRPGFPGTVYSGRAQYYYPGRTVGSCTLGPLRRHGSYASLSPRQFAHGHACGTYVLVHGPAGSVRAEVVDLCPTCYSHTVNLSRHAYDRIGDPRPGVVRVTYGWVADPLLPGPLALRVTAPAADELAIQVLNHGNRLASVGIARPVAGPAAPAWRWLRLAPDDFWVARGLPGPGPFALRITDVLGHTVLLDRLTLRPGTLVRTTAWMYRAAGAAGSGGASARPAPAPTAVARSHHPAASTGTCRA